MGLLREQEKVTATLIPEKSCYNNNRIFCLSTVRFSGFFCGENDVTWQNSWLSPYCIKMHEGRWVWTKHCCDNLKSKKKNSEKVQLLAKMSRSGNPQFPSALQSLTLERTSKVTTPPWYKGGGVDGTPSVGFYCVSIFRRHFAFGWKPLMCSTRRVIYYGLGRYWGLVTSSNMAANMAAISDFTEN